MKAEAWVQKNVMFLPISEHFYRTMPFIFLVEVSIFGNFSAFLVVCIPDPRYISIHSHMDEISHISFLLSFCFRANGIWCHPLTVPPWTPHTFSASCIVVVSLFQCVLFSIQLAVYGVGVGFIQGGGGQTASPLPTGGGGVWDLQEPKKNFGVCPG